MTNVKVMAGVLEDRGPYHVCASVLVRYIDRDVPSYDRSHIGVEDKQRRGDPEQIGGSGDRYRRGSAHNNG